MSQKGNSPTDEAELVVQLVLGPLKSADGGQHSSVGVALKGVFGHGHDGAGMVLRKEAQGAGGSRNRRIDSYANLHVV